MILFTGIGYDGSVLDLSTNPGRGCAELEREWSKLPDFGVPTETGVPGELISCKTYSLGIHKEFGRDEEWLAMPGGSNWSDGKNGNSDVGAKVGDAIIGPAVKGPDGCGEYASS